MMIQHTNITEVKDIVKRMLARGELVPTKEQLIEPIKEMFKDGTIKVLSCRQAGYDFKIVEIDGEQVYEIE